MFFHSKSKSITENKDPCKDYEILCGIEEEFLIVNENGTLVEAADDIMVKGAEILENDPQRLQSLMVQIRSLDAEPSPAQIEYVTLPLPPHELEEAIMKGRQLIVDTAQELGYKILAQSLHPIQSDPNPAVGLHINVSIHRKKGFMTVEELKAVYDYLWNYLPELVAISANSPLFKGSKTDVLSNRFTRSNVLKLNNFSQIEKPENKPSLVRQPYYGRLRYELKIGSRESDVDKRIITNSKGDRLVDITPRGPLTNISDDKDESLIRNRIEIRVFDVQQSKQDVLKLAQLCCASALHAHHLASTGQIQPDESHQQNMENAVYNGLDATFVRGGKKIKAIDSIKSWLNESKRFQDMINVDLSSYADYLKQRRPLQEEIRINVETPDIENMRRQGKIYVIVQLSGSRTIKDQQGRKRRVEGGARIEGKLAADYSLRYEEEENMITNFKSIDITNVLQVKGINIPLKTDDRILRSYDRSELGLQRLFSGFGF